MLAFFLFPSQFEQVQMIIVGAFSTFAAPGQNLFSTRGGHLDGMAKNTTLKSKNNQIMIRPYSFNLHRSLDPPSCSPRWMTHLLVVYTDNFLRPVHMVPTCQKIYIKSMTGCLLTGLFEHEIENKLQHYFSKWEGERAKVFWNFSKNSSVLVKSSLWTAKKNNEYFVEIFHKTVCSISRASTQGQQS